MLSAILQAFAGYFFSAAAAVVIIGVSLVITMVLLMRDSRGRFIVRPYNRAAVCICCVPIFVIPNKERVVLRLLIRIVERI